MTRRAELFLQRWKAIRRKYSLAADITVEEEARKVLTTYPELDEFVMAMGSATFYEKDQTAHVDPDTLELVCNNGCHTPVDDEDPRIAETMKMIDALNDEFKVMGTPMRFTAKGEKITNW